MSNIELPRCIHMRNYKRSALLDNRTFNYGDLAIIITSCNDSSRGDNDNGRMRNGGGMFRLTGNDFIVVKRCIIPRKLCVVRCRPIVDLAFAFARQHGRRRFHMLAMTMRQTTALFSIVTTACRKILRDYE